MVNEKEYAYISILLVTVTAFLLTGCVLLPSDSSILNNDTPANSTETSFQFEYIESKNYGISEFDPTGIDYGIVSAVKRYDAYRAFVVGGEYQDHDFPYRNLRIKKAEQFIFWDPETDEYTVAADLSDCDYGCTNWLHVNNKIYFVAINLNDERFNNPDHDHGWSAPYEIICIDHGDMRVLDSCEGMTGAGDIPMIYEYENRIYYFGSNSMGKHRVFQLKKIDPETDHIEILDSIEYDAEGTETDVMALRKVSAQGTMVCQLFSYIEHSDDRKTSVIHEFNADVGKIVKYEISGYAESAVSLANYIIMNTTSFDEESHQITQQVEIYKKDSKTISGTGLISYQKFAADNDEAIMLDPFTMTKSRPVYRFADTSGKYSIFQDRDWLEDSAVSEYIEKYGVIDSLIIDEDISYIFLGGSASDESRHIMIKATRCSHAK